MYKYLINQQGNNMSNQQEANDTVVAIIPDKQITIKLGITKAALAKLKKKYAKVPDGDTPEGYQAIVEAKRELVPLRTGVVKEANIQKKAAQDHLSNINKVQNFIVSEIQSIEAPQYAEKKRVDDALEKKKLEQEKAEEHRILAIEDAVEKRILNMLIKSATVRRVLMLIRKP